MVAEQYREAVDTVSATGPPDTTQQQRNAATWAPSRGADGEIELRDPSCWHSSVAFALQLPSDYAVECAGTILRATQLDEAALWGVNRCLARRWSGRSTARISAAAKLSVIDARTLKLTLCRSWINSTTQSTAVIP